MAKSFKNLSLGFSAGSLGGLVNSAVVWASGAFGITHRYGVNINPEFTPEWLYPRIIWGGIWGFLFCLPVLEKSWFFRGLILALVPASVQLFIVFPFKTDNGWMGLGLGGLTPVFILIFNMVWGVITAMWLKYAGEK